NDNNLGLRLELQPLLQSGHALADAGRGRGQAKALKHSRWLQPPHHCQRLGARGRLQNFIRIEAPLELLLQPEVVLDNQESWLLVSHNTNLIEKSVPRPGALCTSTSPPSERMYSRVWNAPIPIPFAPFVVS